jgi:L-idonate 5-dehydrogenase
MTATVDPLAVTIFAPEDLRVVAAPLGALKPGFVRVAFQAGGICGSDMHYFRHARTGDFLVTSPLILGHEIAGEIVEINAEAPGLTVGDRVAVNPSRWCGACRHCQECRPNLCENIYFMGSASKTPHMQGGFASRFDAVPAQCVRVPAATSAQAAALAEPLAVCLHAVRRAEPVAGRHVAIFGAGPIGLLTMLAARRAGAASLTAFDVAAAPLEFARRLGADRVVDVSAEGAAERAAKEGLIDIAFEVSGSTAGLTSAIGAVRRGGVVVQIGNLPGGAIPFPANAVMAKEIDLRGSFRFGQEFDDAVRLIVAGEIDVLSIVTAEHALSDAVAGFRAALDRSRNTKVMLVAA